MDGFALAEALRGDAEHRRSCRSSRSPPWSRPSDRTRARGRLPRLRRQVRSHRADRGDQGAERRLRSGGVTAMNDSTRASPSTSRSRPPARCSACRSSACRTCFKPTASPASRSPDRRSPACSICAAASSPRSTCAAGSTCSARDDGDAADGDRHRIAGRIVRASGRCGRRGAQAAGRRARAQSGQSRPQARRASPPACTGSTVSCWWCSTSTACSISAPRRRPHDGGRRR